LPSCQPANVQAQPTNTTDLTTNVLHTVQPWPCAPKGQGSQPRPKQPGSPTQHSGHQQTQTTALLNNPNARASGAKHPS